MNCKKPSVEKITRIAMFLSESLETLDEEYTYQEFLSAVQILFKMQADKFDMHFGPNPGDG